MSACTSAAYSLRGQHLVHASGIEPGDHADLPEHGVVGNVAGVGEVRLQQCLLHPALQVVAALLVAEVDEPVRVDGVEVQGLGEPVDQSVLGSDRLDAVLHLLRALGRLAVLAGQHRAGALGRLGGCARVELEGAPVHLHLVGVLEGVDGLLHAALADVAPGTDDVGPDLDLHVVRNAVRPQAVPDS